MILYKAFALRSTMYTVEKNNHCYWDVAETQNALQKAIVINNGDTGYVFLDTDLPRGLQDNYTTISVYKIEHYFTL